MRTLRYAVAAQVACALLIGCSGSSTDTKSSGGPDTTGTTTPPSVALVTVTPLTLPLQVGSTGSLVAQAFSSTGAQITGKTATWSSSNGAVATVSGGTVTGVGPGNAVITATIDGVNGVANVSVTGTLPGQAMFASIAAGGTHTCALTSNRPSLLLGTQRQWRARRRNAGAESRPVPVSGGIQFANISAGNLYTCGVAISPQGAVYCWGQNPNGQLGDGSVATRLIPTRANVGVSFSSVTAGTTMTCGLATSGIAYCWGTGPSLGNGAATGSATPTAVSNPSASVINSYISVSVGQTHGCALTTERHPYCWGGDPSGALGDGDPQDTTVVLPVAVNGALTLRVLSAAYNGGCGIATDDATYCWGLQLPQNPTGANAPTSLLGGNVFVSLGLGPTASHGCGVTAAGAAYCWGSNSNGQIGDNGSTSKRTTPALVSGGLTWKSLSAGGAHTCGLTTTGAAYCWGSNSDGQLGNSNPSAPTPSAVLTP